MLEKQFLEPDETPCSGVLLIYAVGLDLARLHGQIGEKQVSPPAHAAAFPEHLLAHFLQECQAAMPRLRRKVQHLTRMWKTEAEPEQTRLPGLLLADVELTPTLRT